MIGSSKSFNKADIATGADPVDRLEDVLPDAGRKNREARVAEAHKAYQQDVQTARWQMPAYPHLLTVEHIATCRAAIEACDNHLNDMEVRLLAGQRREGRS